VIWGRFRKITAVYRQIHRDPIRFQIIHRRSMGYAASSRKSWGGRFREDTRRYEGSTGDFESFREFADSIDHCSHTK
jgi:hypothetical protein